MRVRTGYVSNSSSSSFLVMYRDGAKMKLVPSRRRKASKAPEGAAASPAAQEPKKASYLTFDMLLDLIERSPNYCSECTELNALGYDSVVDYLREADSYGYTRYEQEWSDGLVKRMEELSSEYPEAALFHVSYSDKLVRELLRMFIDSGEVVEVDNHDC